MDESDPDGLFDIDPKTGVITVAKDLDRETEEEHELLLLAVDKGIVLHYDTRLAFKIPLELVKSIVMLSSRPPEWRQKREVWEHHLLPSVRGSSPYSPSQNKQKSGKTQVIFGQFGNFCCFLVLPLLLACINLDSRLQFCLVVVMIFFVAT